MFPPTQNLCQLRWWLTVPSPNVHCGSPGLPISICHAILLPTFARCPCGLPILNSLSPTIALFKFSRPLSLPFSSVDLSSASPSLSDLHLCQVSNSRSQLVSPHVASPYSEHSKHSLSLFYVPGTVCRPKKENEMKRPWRILQFFRGWQERCNSNAFKATWRQVHWKEPPSFTSVCSKPSAKCFLHRTRQINMGIGHVGSGARMPGFNPQTVWL